MNKTFKIFDAFVRIVTGSLFTIFISIILIQVFSRYVLNDSIIWAEELARYCFIWMIFFAGGIALDRRAYMGLDLVFRFFSDKKKKYVLLFTDVCVISFLLFLCNVGFEIVGKTMRQTSPSLRIPLGYAYASIPVGSLIILVYAVRRIYIDLKQSEENTLTVETSKKI